MRTATKVLGFAGMFGLATAAAYWFVTYEEAGATLLAFTGLAPLVMAAYTARRGRAELPEDRPDAEPSDSTDQSFTAFPASPWPIGIAIGAVLLSGGFVYGPWLLVLGGAVLAVALVGFVRESRP